MLSLNAYCAGRCQELTIERQFLACREAEWIDDDGWKFGKRVADA
jgi:hypothetical protein